MNEEMAIMFSSIFADDKEIISWNDEVPDMSISKNIVEIAEQKGISNEELAKSVGITLEKFFEIKYDFFKFSDDLVKKFAAALETDVETLKVIDEDFYLPLKKDLKK